MGGLFVLLLICFAGLYFVFIYWCFWYYVGVWVLTKLLTFLFVFAWMLIWDFSTLFAYLCTDLFIVLWVFLFWNFVTFTEVCFIGLVCLIVLTVVVISSVCLLSVGFVFTLVGLVVYLGDAAVLMVFNCFYLGCVYIVHAIWLLVAMF